MASSQLSPLSHLLPSFPTERCLTVELGCVFWSLSGYFFMIPTHCMFMWTFYHIPFLHTSSSFIAILVHVSELNTLCAIHSTPFLQLFLWADHLTCKNSPQRIRVVFRRSRSHVGWFRSTRSPSTAWPRYSTPAHRAARAARRSCWNTAPNPSWSPVFLLPLTRPPAKVTAVGCRDGGRGSWGQVQSGEACGGWAGKKGTPSLFLCAGHHECLEILVSWGIDVDQDIPHLGTPLYTACVSQQFHCIRKLLYAGNYL